MSAKESVTFPIDIVYTWVDGNDEAWREKRNRYMPNAQNTAKAPNHMCEARWRENNELMYSLRSVERFAPWVNKIYIVTDGQRPAWLNDEHPKIKVIDHTEIIPEDALPVFSSHAIESCLHLIPNLSEHYIVGNDDTFFGAMTHPEDFFNADGRPIVRLRGARFNRRRGRRGGNYYRVLYRMQSIAKRLWGKLVCHEPHHNFDAYRRSDVEHCAEVLNDEWQRTTRRKFRHNKDIQRCVVSYYTVATKRAELRLVGRYNRIHGIVALIKALVTGRYAADSRWIKLHLPDYKREFIKYNPLMFCMNDNAQTSDEDCKRMIEFLDEMFPHKSQFER